MYTLAQLRELARQRADMENSSFVTDPELTRYINDAIDELFGLLVVSYGQEYFYTSAELTTSEDVAAYSLDARAFKLLRVDVLTGEGYEPLRPWRFPGPMFAARSSAKRTGRLPRYRWAGEQLIFEPPPSGAYTFRVHYVPKPSALEDDSDELPAAYGTWAEYVIVTAAIKCLRKQQTDTTELTADKLALRQSIKETAPPRDAGYPQTIVDDRYSGYDDGGEPGGWTAAFVAAVEEEEEEMDVAKVRRANAQSVAALTLAAVSLPTTAFQKGSSAVPNTGVNAIAVTENGYYRVEFNARWGIATTGGIAIMYPKSNGALLDAETAAVVDLNPAGEVNQGAGNVFQLNAGDLVTLEALHTDSAPLNIEAVSLALTKIASA